MVQSPHPDLGNRYIPSLSDSLRSVGDVGTGGVQQVQLVNPSNNQISQGIHTSVEGIAPETLREAAWDLANQYPSSSYSTIDSIVEEVLTEERPQFPMEAFSAEYHAMDGLFLVNDSLRRELEQPDGPLQNESPEESGTRS